jgi:hypothetical protein
MTKHTPTPWKVETGGFKQGYASIETENCSYEVILSCKEEDAAFIVHAVNNHEGLVAALQQAEMDFETMFSCLGKQDKELCAVIKTRIKAAIEKVGAA